MVSVSGLLSEQKPDWCISTVNVTGGVCDLRTHPKHTYKVSGKNTVLKLLLDTIKAQTFLLHKFLSYFFNVYYFNVM